VLWLEVCSTGMNKRDLDATRNDARGRMTRESTELDDPNASSHLSCTSILLIRILLELEIFTFADATHAHYPRCGPYHDQQHAGM